MAESQNVGGIHYDVAMDVNTTKFILYDNQFLTVGPFFSPVDGDQMWIHLQAQLGGGDNCNAIVEIWKINTDNEEIAGTRQSFNTALSAFELMRTE